MDRRQRTRRGRQCAASVGVCRLRGPARGWPEQTARGLRGAKPPGLGVRGLPPGPTQPRKIMVVLDDAEVSRILVINAHPDDVDFGAAGTVARWTDAGIKVVYCVVTDGDAGGSDPTVSRSDMAALRRGEQTEAARQVGVHDLRFLGYPDGRVEATLGLRRDLARMIRQVRPDRVVCPSPERNYVRPGISHPDHRAVGSAALDAVYPDARNP